MTDTPDAEEAQPRWALGHESFQAIHVLTDHYRYELLNQSNILSISLHALANRGAEGEAVPGLFEQAFEPCERIRRVARDLNELVGRSNSDTGPVSVQEILDRVVRFTRVEWERKCRVERDGPPELPGVKSPRGWLNRVFFGLVLDALAAMRSRAPQQHVLRLSTRSQEGSVRVTISATGPGLPPRMMPHLFEPLCPPPVPGVGQWLGLYRLRALVETMGGALQVESQPERGVTFDVHLPVEGRAGEDPPPRPLEGPWLRALQNDERNAVRALMALTAEEILTLHAALRPRLKRIAGLQKEHEEKRSRRNLKRCFRVLRHLRDAAQGLRFLRYVQPEPPLPVYVEGCLTEALRITRGQLPRTARVEEELAPDLPPVLGSAGHLLRVFLLLLRGTLQAMRLDPSREHVLRVRTWREDSWIRVDLTSPVVLPEHRSSFLENGYLSLPTGSFPEYGVPISQAILQAMGGELRLDGEEGQGTTYSVRLPVAERP